MTFRGLKTLVVAGTITMPFSASAKSFKEIVEGDIVPFGDRLIALLFALIFIFFLIGILRLFFSTNPESRENGKLFALYGIVGLAVLVSVWGLVRVLLGVLESFV